MDYKSELNGLFYYTEDLIFIENELQAKRYISHHVLPVDLIPSDNKEDKLIFVFIKSKTKELFLKWKDYDLPWNKNEK